MEGVSQTEAVAAEAKTEQENGEELLNTGSEEDVAGAVDEKESEDGEGETQEEAKKEEEDGGDAGESRKRSKGSARGSRHRISNKARYYTTIVTSLATVATLQRRSKTARSFKLEGRAKSCEKLDKQSKKSVMGSGDAAVAAAAAAAAAAEAVTPTSEGPPSSSYRVLQRRKSEAPSLGFDLMRPDSAPRALSTRKESLTSGQRIPDFLPSPPPATMKPTAANLKERQKKCLEIASCKLRELLETEKTYVFQNLTEVVDGYYTCMEDTKREMKEAAAAAATGEATPAADGENATTTKSGKKKLPEGLIGGKDRIVFGNIRAIFDFHKRIILPEMEKCVSNPKALRPLFGNRRDRFKTVYGKFCLNNPKSEYIISEFEKYFAVLRLAEGYRQNLATQMMTPIQRVTRYQLLLREIDKSYSQLAAISSQLAEKLKEEEEKKVTEAKEGEGDTNGDVGDAAPNGDEKDDGESLTVEGAEKFALEMSETHAEIRAAYEITHEIAEYANDMMVAGRINGFNGDVTAQGLLLKRGRAQCYKRRSALKKVKLRPCQFFVFQETVIICHDTVAEPQIGIGQNLEYMSSFKMNKLVVREISKGDGTFGFELERVEDRRCSSRRDGTGGGASGNGAASTSGQSAHHHEAPVIVIQCEKEEQRDEWLKTINNQIRELKDIGKRLENPQWNL